MTGEQAPSRREERTLRRSDLIWIDPRLLIEERPNVRREADDEGLEGLAATIREHGILQPLGVRRVNGHHALVYGSRRRRAAILAGLEAVPCVEVAGGASDPLALQLLEN